MNVIKIKTGIVETNTYFIVNDNGKCVIIDPGDDTAQIMSVLESNAVTCTAIFLTHGHFDHCNACQTLQSLGAKIYMHKNDVKLIRSEDNLASKFGVYFNKFKPDYLIANGDVITIDGITIEVIHTPGHTAGSCCYIVDNFMFTGDTIMHLSCGRTDFPSGSKRDMTNSLKKLMKLNKNYLLFPGHYQSTNLDFEKKNNPYVQF